MGAGSSALESHHVKPVNEIDFTINGMPYKVLPKCHNNEITSTTSLNYFIRNVAQLKGTKMMCFEGGCGSCLVSAEFIHPVTHKRVHVSVNSCLVTVFSCQGWSITTIEGIGNKKDGYHIVQKRLAEFNGTQCGYCSPGMVMNMYALYETNPNITEKEIENSFGGNICRCTGYRPICDAFKSLAENSGELQKRKSCCGDGCCGELVENEKQTYISIDLGTEKWFKVYKLKELLVILNEIGDLKYMLVAGNTANGVFRRPFDIEVYIDISSIPELHQIEISTEICLGGNVSLTEAMRVFSKIAKEKPEFKYLQEIYEHWDLVANVPVRNIGTVAGNLMLKHQYPRFQSDIFVCLETFGAEITVVNKDGNHHKYSPIKFLNHDMVGHVISKINFYPLTGNHIYRTYKIMPRSQNTHAIINAGFNFKVKNDLNTIEEARIIYGAINTTFSRAKITENSLSGKQLFDDNTLQEAYRSLNSELQCDTSPPDPSPDARKQLAIALFYKFVLSVAPPNLVKQIYRSGGSKFDRPISSGKQSFEVHKDKFPLTQPIPKIEALVQCSGEAKYVVDHDTSRRDFHYANFVLANTQPGSVIKEIKTLEALGIPGVAAVLTSEDIMGRNSFIPSKTVFITNQAEEILCTKEVKYNGQPVALVVADSLTAAMEASALVTVTYGKGSKNLVYKTRDAINIPENPRIKLIRSHPREKTGHHIRKVIQGNMDFGSQYHFTMETQTCVCIPIEDGLEVYPSHQWMDLAQVGIAECCNLPEKDINVSVRRLGGGYGAKIARANLIACACAVAATKLQKPVYLHMGMEDSVKALGKRFPCSADYELAVDGEGSIQYLNLSYYSNYGYLSNEAADAFLYPALINCYDTSTWAIQGYAVQTDLAANCYMRAPGTCEAIAMLEVIMDHIAMELGKDPAQVRMLNLPRGSPLTGLITQHSKDSEIEDRLHSVQMFNRENRWRKRGIGMVAMSWPFDYAGNFYSQVSIYRDGTVAISHGGIEMGQGINTKAVQVAAYALGLDVSQIQIKPSNTLTAPNNLVTGGSIGSESVCFATLQACNILKSRIEPVKKKLGHSTWKQTINSCLSQLVDLTASYQFTQADKVSSYSIYGVTYAEVEVDILTGNTEIKRVDLLEDIGESMSPEVDIGQIEGAFVTGLGYWLSEEVIINPEDGSVLNTRTWTYHPPGMKDIPIDWRIQFRKNSSNEKGVLGSKATGEPPLCMSIAVPLAIRHALGSARKDSDSNADAWFSFDGPTTASEVLLKSLPSYQQYKIK